MAKSDWEKRNPEKLREYRRRWESKHWENRLWNNAKRNARIKGRPFDIEQTDVIIPTHCPIFGFPLVTGSSGRERSNPATASLDCINPELGYVKGNVWVISFLANRMKQNATKEQLQQFCSGVLTCIEQGKI